jgi:hypothetical protein
MKILIMLLLMILTTKTNQTPDYVTVDKVELNHFYNERTSKLQFSQIIVRKWLKLPESVGYRVIKYDLVENPLILRKNGGYLITYVNSSGVEVRYFTKIFRIINSNFDIELKDRELFPEKDRP